MSDKSPDRSADRSPPAPNDLLWQGTIRQINEKDITFQIPSRFQIPENIGVLISPRIFTSTYYDSEQHRLGRLGLTLRNELNAGAAFGN